MVIYSSRPPATRKSARIAWDILVDKRLPETVVKMWFARFGPGDFAWTAEYTNGDFEEVDSLCIADRIKNPQKYSEKNRADQLQMKIVDRVIDMRSTMSGLGVDFGADASVLAINGLERLVWVKPHFSMIGGNGMPGARINSKATLEIRSFIRLSQTVHGAASDESYIQWESSHILDRGGRLSKARIAKFKSAIDSSFGDGATEKVNPRKTVIFGNDEIGAYLVEKRSKHLDTDPKVSAFIRAAENAVVTSDGIRI